MLMVVGLPNKWYKYKVFLLEGIKVREVLNFRESREEGYILEKQLLFNREVFVYKNRPKSIDDMLKRTAGKYPNKEAIITDNVRLTYSELIESTEQVALHLQHYYKLQKGDRVALLIGNKLEFVQMFLACATLGIITVPLNIRSSEEELIYMLNHADVSLICADSDYRNVVEIWQRKDESQSAIFLEQTSNTFNSELFASIFDKNYDHVTLQKPNVHEEDPLYIIFTSGTTGLPKGAIGSHVNVIHSALNYNKILKLPEETRTLIAVPLFHVTGLIGQLFYMMLIGGTSVLMQNYQTEQFLKRIEEERITFLFNVPAIYIMMLNHRTFDNTNVSTLKTIAYGGAPMSQETIEHLMEKLPDIFLHNAYGATETSSPATIMPQQQYEDIVLGSVGQPVPVSEMKIIGENDEILPPGEVGELYIKGPMIIGEYWRNDTENKKNFVDGFWKSGDMAMIDKEDFVYIMDRKKDMINRGGEKIFSVEVENCLYEHPHILEVAVVGVSDDIFGEAVKAFIVPKLNENVDLQNVQSFLKGKLAKYKIPEYVEIIEEMPRNAGGKILKNELTGQSK